MPTGLNYLLHRGYGVPYLQESEFDSLWTVWDSSWKNRVKPDDKGGLRKLTAERYGFPPSIDSGNSFSLAFVRTKDGLIFNCMMCHGGKLPGTGKSMVGLPNNDVDMVTFQQDLDALRKQPDQSGRWGATRGTTNAFMISHALLMYRDKDLNFLKEPVDLGPVQPYPVDPPAWWLMKRKGTLYSDAFVEGSQARAIMQFAMAGPPGSAIRGWEEDFKTILGYLKTLEAPKYPWSVDKSLAATGKTLFDKTCSGCHGTYGADGKYPAKVIPINVIGTDSLRLTAMTHEFRRYYGQSWLGQGSKVTEKPEGYLAPALDGVWATAPYFHNGSVPTIEAVLSSKSRPKAWRKKAGYDQNKVGLQADELGAAIPADASASERRRVIDTTARGMGNGGHPFGDALSEQERRAVLEYLKTL
jgi:mono/diheme cytochrome c family protein